MARKKKKIDGKTYLLDRRSSRKTGLGKVGKYGKKSGAIRGYRVVKEGKYYGLYIKP